MLVKELRQGLRAKLFVTVFLALQGLLALILLTSIAGARAPGSAGETISGIIFMCFTFAVLIIQPLRGIGTLHREIQGLTIELIVLTRLTAWKIVLGKWISLVGQSALLTAAIIPYLVLRYWFGEMNLFGELSLFLIIFVLSAVATAVVVGISSVPSVILRGLLPLLVAGVGMFTIPNLFFGYAFDELVEIASMQTPETFWGVALTLLGAVYFGWTTLGIAVSMIAPAAENHSTLRRAITLGLLGLIAALAPFVTAPTGGWIALTILVIVPAAVLALTEPFILLPPLYRPFARFGFAGRLASRVLAPGWPSGVIFTLLAFALGALILDLARDDDYSLHTLAYLFALAGSVLMPAAFVAPFARKFASPLTFYMLVLAVSSLLVFLSTFVANAFAPSARGFLWWFSWVPPTGFIMTSFGGSFDPQALCRVFGGVAAIYALALLGFALPRLRQANEFEKACRAETKPSPAAESP